MDGFKLREQPYFVACCAALTLVTAMFFLHLEGNSDIFWQMKTGQIIWFTKAIPQVDPFSYTAAGKAWINHEWLSGVIFYQVLRIGGFAGLSVLSFAIGLCLALTLFAAIGRASCSVFLSLFLTFAILFIGAPRFQQLRPELFGFLFFSTMLMILTRKDDPHPRYLWTLIPLLVIWANTHASAIIAPPFIMLYAASAIWLEKRWRMSPIFFFVLIAACAAALLANPFTYRIYSFPFEHLGQSFSLSITSDWASPRWFRPEIEIAPWGLVFVCAISLALAMRRWRRLPLAMVAVSLISIVPGFMMARFLPFAAISVCILLAEIISADMRDMAPETSGVLALLSMAICICASLLMFNTGPVYGIRSGDGHSALTLGRSAGVGLDKKNFPADAADFIRKHSLKGNIFNDMAWGGYLIWRLWPDVRIFIDTRTPVYGDEFIKEYSDALFIKESFDALVKKYNIDYVLYDVRQMEAPGGPLKFLFDNPEWVPISMTYNAAIFQRNASPPQGNELQTQ